MKRRILSRVAVYGALCLAVVAFQRYDHLYNAAFFLWHDKRPIETIGYADESEPVAIRFLYGSGVSELVIRDGGNKKKLVDWLRASVFCRVFPKRFILDVRYRDSSGDDVVLWLFLGRSVGYKGAEYSCRQLREFLACLQEIAARKSLASGDALLLDESELSSIMERIDGNPGG